MQRIAIAALVLTWMAPVSAESPANLRVRAFPTVTPSSLAMRTELGERVRAEVKEAKEEKARAARVAQAESNPAPLDPEVGEEVETLEIEARLRERIRASDALGERRDLDDKVVLQVSLGVGIDGGQPSGEVLASGAELDQESAYARLRTYGFGELVIGTNGLGLRSLSSYTATSYRFNRKANRETTPIPSVYDGNFRDFIVRSAWIDLKDVFDSKLWKPVYFRVGRQYKYAAAIAHFSGLTVGYNTKSIRGSLWSGTRAEPYSSVPSGEASIAGGDLTVDLYELRRVPLVLSGSALRFDGRNHLDGAATVRFGRNALLRGSVRTLSGSLAQETVRVRARITEVTTVSAELDNRHAGDWVYDLILVNSPAGTPEQTDARTYLNLGQPRPRARGALRAGTVLLRNIDLLASFAAALEYSDDDANTPISTRATYIEAGTAVEIRLRRNLRVGLSGLGRAYRRPTDGTMAPSLGDDPAPLFENTADTGETAFVESGLSLRYSLGARIFSASAEFYGRAYRFQTPTDDPIEGPDNDVRAGGRFSLDGWATKRVRVKLRYDLSLAEIRIAPELNGVKTLRIAIEGTF